MIARFFLAKYTSEYKRPEIKGFSPSALSLMRRYRWPGNVRELENAVKKGVILCDKALVSPEDMGISEERRENLSIKPLAEAKEEWQREYILRALEANDKTEPKPRKFSTWILGRFSDIWKKWTPTRKNNHKFCWVFQ
jgi:DNA-binding NtrC family response regulator